MSTFIDSFVICIVNLFFVTCTMSCLVATAANAVDLQGVVRRRETRLPACRQKSSQVGVVAGPHFAADRAHQVDAEVGLVGRRFVAESSAIDRAAAQYAAIDQ